LIHFYKRCVQQQSPTPNVGLAQPPLNINAQSAAQGAVGWNV